MWIDAHCHLADPRFEQDLEVVLARSKQSGISAWVQGGVDPSDWQRQRLLATRFPNEVIPVFGLHPWFVAKMELPLLEMAFEKLKAEVDEARALGETGLDFSTKHFSTEGNERQIYFFKQQVQLAQLKKKPLVLHVVHAHDEALSILKKVGPFASGGLVHAFSSHLDHARAYRELGFLISVGGAVTRPGYKMLKAALKSGLEGVVLETDCPDFTPFELGEVRNEPANLKRIAEVVAEMMKLSSPDLLESSSRHLAQLFSL